MRISITNKNGTKVRLDADFHLDVEKVYFQVHCDGVTFEFNDFAPAAKIYKDLSRRIEAEADVSMLLGNLVKGARILGFKVMN